MSLEGLRADGFPGWSWEKTQASFPASLPAQPPLFLSAAALPSLWLTFSLSLGTSVIPQLLRPPLFSKSSFRPLVLLLMPDLHCYACSSLSVCLSVHLSIQ